MKRLLSILLAALIMLTAFTASAENWYVTQGRQLAQRLHSLANDESYSYLYAEAGEITALIDDFAAADLSAPTEAQMLVLPETGGMLRLISLLGRLAGEKMPSLSETVTEEIDRRLPGMLISLVNGKVSAAWIAASSILTTSETHIRPEDFQPGVLLLEYPGAYSVAVAFSRTGEDTITATATAVQSGFTTSFSEDMGATEQAFLNSFLRELPLN